jgi:DNA-binding MarR family transcriptional regulator
MVRIVAHLEREQLLQRIRPPGERRRYGLFLTPLGQAKVEEYLHRAVAYDQEFFAVLTARERADLSRLLRKLRAAYQGHTLGAGDDEA